jgi:catechol 2,3-dioxygenase-like lactoylglutathione lyase family enzyme
MIKLSAPDGSVVELLKDEAHPTSPPKPNALCNLGIRHIAFTVADITESWRVLRESGCQTLSEPIFSPDRKVRLFFARDPEGNLIEIVQMLAKQERE